jgi:hypothetical protein
MNENFGLYYYICDGIRFNTQIDAMIYSSSKPNIPEIKLMYHHDIWSNFDTSSLGKVNLDVLYRERCLQLREKYDYLILNFSGGSDSSNILMSFINNNIQLDEIYVAWPKPLQDGKFYIPNTIDSTARNILSEWDYSIKTILDWVSKNHPKIKINVDDYMENINIKMIDNMYNDFSKLKHCFGYSLGLAGRSIINIPNKKVARIYGVDKPLISLNTDNNVVSMFFTDHGLWAIDFGKNLDISPECFYWTPDLPQLPFEMAYALSEYFNINRDKRHLMYSRKYTSQSRTNMDQLAIIKQYQNDISKKMCYSTWNNSFQANKSATADISCHWFWLYENSEFNSFKQAFISNSQSIKNNIAEKYIIDVNVPGSSLKATTSYMYPFRKLDQ